MDPTFSTNASTAAASIPCATQSSSSLPFRKVHGVSLSSLHQVSSFDAESMNDAFQFGNLLNSVIDHGDDDTLLMPREDLGNPPPNLLAAQSSNNFMSQSLTSQNVLVGESYPGFSVNADGGSAVLGQSSRMNVHNALNQTITSNNNQASGANSLQSPVGVTSSGTTIVSNLGHVFQAQLHKPIEELDGKSLTLRIGSNANLGSKSNISSNQVPQRSYGNGHHQASTSLNEEDGNMNLLIPEPNNSRDFQMLEHNKGAFLSMNHEAATSCSVYDIRPTAFSIWQPVHVHQRPEYLTTNNRTFGPEDHSHVRYGGAGSSRTSSVQGYGSQATPPFNCDAGQFSWIRSPSISSPLVHGTTQHAFYGVESSNMQTYCNSPNVSPQITSPVGWSGVAMPPRHHQPGTLILGQQAQSQHLAEPSTTYSSHGSLGGSPSASQLSVRDNILAAQFRKRVAFQQPPTSSILNPRRTRPCHIANTIQTNFTHSSQVVSLVPHLGQTAPAPVQAPPTQMRKSSSSQGISFATHQTVPIRPTISTPSPSLSSVTPQTIPIQPNVSKSSSGSSSAMHQTVAIRPTISNSLKTVLPEAPSTLPLSHKPYLHFRPPSKQMAPPPAAAVKLSNRNVPDPTQTSPYHRIKWQDGDSDEKQKGFVGHKCSLCKRDLSYPPEGPIVETAMLPPSAVLACGHTFHDFCLQRITPPDMGDDPPCIPCAIGED